MSTQPNVLLVTIDSLRADHVYTDLAETPTFDSLAQDGTAFDSAFAQGPYTTFSMPSMFTSKYPSQLTSIDFVEGVEGVLVEGESTIPQRLAAAGYTTAGVHTNPLLSDLFGFDVGFDYFDDGLRGLSDRLSGRFALLADKVGRLVRRHPYVPADTLTDRATEWLRTNDSEPFFLWVHYMDPHGPHQSRDGFQYLEKYRAEALWRKAVHSPDDVSEEERRRLRETYAEEVELTDRAISRLLDSFGEAVGTREPMTVLTADHGDEFHEHGSYSHESKLYEELLHVPLIVDPPSRRTIDRDPTALTPILDVAPTILDAAGASVDGLAGTSLFEPSSALRQEEDKDTRADSESEATIDEPAVISEARLNPAYAGAIRTAKWKYIDDDGNRELYDLETDPDESENVLSENDELATRFASVLAVHRERHSGERRDAEHLWSDELDTQLRSLGYIE